MIDKKYNIIYADPPWNFEKGLWNRSQSKASFHYPTMTATEICELPVSEIIDKNCHLYLWTTSTHLMNGDAIKVIKNWGFRPMNIITWCKPQISLGYYFRNSTEHLLFGVKGKLRTLDRKQNTYVVANREKHSKKPAIFREIIIQCSGDLSRIELFAREKTIGWDIWGNEIESDIDLLNS